MFLRLLFAITQDEDIMAQMMIRSQDFNEVMRSEPATSFDFYKVQGVPLAKATVVSDPGVTYLTWIIPGTMARVLHQKFVQDDRADVSELVTYIAMGRDLDQANKIHSQKRW